MFVALATLRANLHHAIAVPIYAALRTQPFRTTKPATISYHSQTRLFPHRVPQALAR